MIKKIISGGQIGADIAALRAARGFGIPTGGFAPKGFKTLNGPNLELRDIFDLVETESQSYPPRTFANVKNSDCTLRFAKNFDSRGELCTLKAIFEYHKPYKDVQLPIDIGDLGKVEREIALWLEDINAECVNVAGNADTDIETVVESILNDVFFMMMVM